MRVKKKKDASLIPIIPHRIIFINPPCITLRGQIATKPCSNCFGMDLQNAEEKCPSCDNQGIVLTMVERQ
jgi:hypothetical protein